MFIPGRQRWILWHTGRRLRRSCPHLAAMLAIFTRLTAGEAITSREQHCWADGRLLRSLARLGRVLARLGRVLAAAAARLSAGGRRAGRRLRCAGGALCSRFSGNVRSSAGFPPVAGHPGDPK